MPTLPRCQVCDGSGVGGRQIGSVYACPTCLELATKRAAPKKSPLLDRLKACEEVPHVIIEARAGTGKTTTLIEGIKYMKGMPTSITPSEQQQLIWDQLILSKGASTVTFVAFNKSITTELQNRVPTGCSVMTMHSLGFKAGQQAFGRLKVNKWRIMDIISEVSKRDIRELYKTEMDVLKATEQIVGLCKMNLVDSKDRKALWDLVSHYDVDLNGNSTKVFGLVDVVLDRCKDVSRDRCIDFNDMVWLPVALNLPVNSAQVLLVDEAQDLNRCQQALALKTIGDTGRLILCGDPCQAIYGFAGADAESMPRMLDTLSQTSRGCVHLPLTVTRRCGKAIVAEAQKIVPDFEYHESNCEGLILEAGYKGEVTEVVDGVIKSYHQLTQDGDMILCRVNAPLVSQCFKFLKAGRRAQIQGRDIGRGLINLIKKLKAEDIAHLSEKLSDWHHAECQKELAKRMPNEDRLIALQDKMDCLECFIEGVNTVEEVITKIEAVFTDDRDNPGVKLSSIHKAKGLEAGRVFFLRPEGAGCPHPMAKTKWAIEQEHNLCYVAITRAIKELVYVS